MAVPPALAKLLKNPGLQPVCGLPPAAWPAVAGTLAGKQPLLIVAPEPGLVEGLLHGLKALGVENLHEFPAWDVQPYDRLGPGAHIAAARTAVVNVLKTEKNPVIVTSVSALGVRVGGGTAPELVLTTGQTIDQNKVLEQLAGLGYARNDVVQEAATFARRGGVIDVFPPAAESPVRIEWFDDEIESIREFETTSQRTANILHKAIIGPAQAVVDEGAAERFRSAYRSYVPDGMEDDVYVAVSEGQSHPLLGQMAALLDAKEWKALPELLPQNTLVLAPDDYTEQAELWAEGVAEAYARRVAVANEAVRAIPPEVMFVQASGITAIGTFSGLNIHRFADETSTALHFSTPDYMLGGSGHNASSAAAQDVARKLENGWRVAVLAASAPGLAVLVKALEGEAAHAGVNVNIHPVENWQKVKAGQAVSAISTLPQGWADADGKLLVVTEGDVFGRRVGGQAPRKKRRTEDLIAHFSELRDGDYVVHEDHGIGRFGGLTTMDVAGVTQDFLKVFYAGDDRLLLPVENLDVLSRYKGAESGHVQLDRLGTGGWQVRKEKVKEDLLIMADELLRTAAARALVERPAIDGAATTALLYTEFCAGFPYPLTDDQESVMAEVETDLTAPAPMDRLVVGDVGFGKTEVALRAAFLAAAAGRQVAVVCPTTLLARQHLAVFQQRFAGFGLAVGGLSRLVSANDAKRVKAGLKDGTISIVVGTHALLGAIEFSNLGLVIIDEEQRFGVAHKEKLKQLRAACDILTLTATPIPRTLQMAVGGVKSLSLITTPPVDRLAVSTYVLPWDNVTLGEAIRRELARGGQVYVVAPHVEDLGGLEKSLHELHPDARIGVAHGQLPEGELEDVMVAFYDAKLDILLATTIIESGIDVPRANTLIVYRADRFGLAQLYQLRGRVGRSTTRAFAYFLLPAKGQMSADAAKRLQILQRLEGLGAGFTLASYDMDLRGFGNLLGKQQSGHIRDIGFELYTKMLKDAVTQREKERAAKKAARTGVAPPETPAEAPSVTLKLGLTYLIPDAYVPDVATRLQLYRKLASAHTEEALADGAEEMRDRFGTPPTEVENLLKVVALRNRAAALNIEKIDVGEKGVVITLANGKFPNPDGLIGLMLKMKGVYTARPEKNGTQSLVIHRRPGEGAAKLAALAVMLGELEAVAVPA